MGELQWYVLKVVSKREEKIKASLQAEVAKENLQHAIGEIHIPYEKVYEVRAGKKHAKNKHLFPGYILLQADLSNEMVMSMLKGINGALGFLGMRGWGASTPPVPLRKTEIDRLIGKAGSMETAELSLRAIFAVGEMIEITDGPFAGFSGKIEEIFEEKKTINVLVKIFDDRITPVELNYTQVKKIL